MLLNSRGLVGEVETYCGEILGVDNFRVALSMLSFCHFLMQRAACVTVTVCTVAERSVARVCSRSTAGSASSKPTEAWMFGCRCLLSSGRCLFGGPIIHPEESYRLWCLIVCDLKTSVMRRSWPALGCCTKKSIMNPMTDS
jgi:hypothetical protein